MKTVSNPQMELAYHYVNYTNQHIFLTGNAGTGKTTFLHRIKKEAVKRLAVVAPTGVAAINAQGVTIHSLFQLPFGPLVPGQLREEMKTRRFAKKKINLLRSLDLLIIDEISMVRADVLDGIDEVLRRYRRNSRPFGGLQLLMIGDLHQLPPVVRDEEWDLLRGHYETLYFFGSQALKKTAVVTIELQHIYRQVDLNFIGLLNKVRANQMTDGVLEQLNSRYRPNFRSEEKDGYITLSAHNATARRINAEKLMAVPGEAHHFEATITDHFPQHAYPTEAQLEFKVGAQVMFMKNDPTPEKLYFNGKIGHIVDIDDELISVRCPEDDFDIHVGRAEWRNVKYSLNETTKEVHEELLGTFSQFPLKLAWAITIHKSQGLTFERVVIDAAAAFAHGQVYVALSRCKSFEGIVLRSQIGRASVRTDRVVHQYTEVKRQNQPGQAELVRAKRHYQQGLLLELFSFKKVKNTFEQLHRALLEHEASLSGNTASELSTLLAGTKEHIFSLAQKFMPQLQRYFTSDDLPEENETLQARMCKAGHYFTEQLKKRYDESLQLEIVSDNKAVRQKVKEKLNELKKEFFIKKEVFNTCSDGFSTQDYIRTLANAELDFDRTVTGPKAKKQVPKDAVHPELYHSLAQWRADLASEREIERYTIMPTRSLLEIVAVLPSDMASLKRIHGIGKQRAKNYGPAILEQVRDFCEAHQLPTDQLQFATGKAPKPAKPPRPDTKSVSLKLFQSGKSIAEIAGERGFVPGTIYGHLAHFVKLGQLDPAEVLGPAATVEIRDYLSSQRDSRNLTKARDHFGGKYSFGMLKVVVAGMTQGGE